jgi:class 3 adenylate cyclase
MAEDRVDRRLAAIFAGDIAGYSRLMGVDEEGTLRQLKAHRKELVDPKITEHRGRIVKTTGDGMLVEFFSVVDAVRCDVDIQRGMADATRRYQSRSASNSALASISATSLSMATTYSAMASTWRRGCKC